MLSKKLLKCFKKQKKDLKNNPVDMWITQLWEIPKVYTIQTAVAPTGFPAGPYVKNEALESLVIRSKA